MISWLIVAYCFFLIIHHRYYWVSNLKEWHNIPGDEFLAHRGLKTKHPENTIHAYIDAVENKFSWLEVDIVSTKDNVIVCSHNFDLERETECVGYIHEMNFKEFNFNNIRTYGNKESIYKIPMLDEVLENIPSNIGINLEIKTSTVFDLSTARAFKNIKQKCMGRPYFVSSFNPIVLFYFKIFYRDVPIGFLLESEKLQWLTNWIHPHLLIPRADMLNKEMFNYCKNKNLPILTWTVNNLHAINWCKNKNIFGIITDIEK